MRKGFALPLVLLVIMAIWIIGIVIFWTFGYFKTKPQIITSQGLDTKTEGTTQANFSLAPDEISFVLYKDQTVDNQFDRQLIAIRSEVEDQEVIWVAKSSNDWLNLSSAEGITPADITIYPNKRAIEPGGYKAEVIFRDKSDSKNKQTLIVKVCVHENREKLSDCSNIFPYKF